MKTRRRRRGPGGQFRGFPELLAIAAALASYQLMRIALGFSKGRMKKIAKQTSNRIDDTVVKVLGGSNRWLRC